MAAAVPKRGALQSRMGRPLGNNTLPSFSQLVKDQITALRAEHPGWGARFIHDALLSNPLFIGTKIPSIRSIGSYLKANKLVRRYDKHTQLPNVDLHDVRYPHERWQLDAQGGFMMPGLGPIAVLNIKDVFTKIYCMTYPNLKSSIYGHSKGAAYQCALRLAFMEFGLPQSIQTDHEGIFIENKGKSPFPTTLHLWLLSLGVRLCFSRLKRPTDQATVERMHQTMEKQVTRTSNYCSWGELFDFCQQRRYVLNERFPCRSLDGKAPLQKYPQARHSGRYFHFVSEKQLMDMEKIYEYLSEGIWYRRVSNQLTLTLGGQVYYVSKALKKSQLVIKFDPCTKMLHFYNEEQKLLDKLAIKGMEKDRIMGKRIWQKGSLQLTLPFG